LHEERGNVTLLLNDKAGNLLTFALHDEATRLCNMEQVSKTNEKPGSDCDEKLLPPGAFEGKCQEPSLSKGANSVPSFGGLVLLVAP
jgi:hypothetical protein